MKEATIRISGIFQVFFIEYLRDPPRPAHEGFPGSRLGLKMAPNWEFAPI